MRRKRKRDECFRILIVKLQKGGFFYPKDLETTLKLPSRTVMSGLRRGKYLGFFKQKHKKGPYAWWDYESEEEEIREVIHQYCPNGIPLYSQTKYRLETDVVEEIIRDAGIRTGRDFKNQKFRDLVFKVIKKFYEKKNA